MEEHEPEVRLAGQLTSEVRSGYNVAYTYDANGNRISKTVNGVAESYTYDLGDKMLTARAKSYTYDATGRTVGIHAPGIRGVELNGR